MKEKTVFLGRICRKISLGDTQSPWQASLSYGFTSSELGLQNRRRRADEGLSQNWAASSPHMFTQLAGVWAGPSAEKQLLWSAHIWPEAVSALGLVRARDWGTCLGHEGVSLIWRQSTLWGPPDLWQFQSYYRFTSGRWTSSEPGKVEVDPGKMCLLTMWDGLRSQTSWCGKRDSTHIMCRMCTYIMCINVW